MSKFDELSGSVLADSKAMQHALDKHSTQFGDLYFVDRVTQIDVESHYQLSEQTNIWETTGSASVDSGVTDSEILLSTTANGADSAYLETSEVGRYVAGYAAEAGIGVRIPQNLTGNQRATWGYYSDLNGFYFGLDSDGPYVARLRDGSETRVYQENWNVDTVTGQPSDDDNPSGLTLDYSNGNVCRIDFSWYGYGAIRFIIMMRDDSGEQKPVVVHTLSAENETSVKNPNLPVRVDVDNSGTADAFDMYVGGRQFAIYGDPDSTRRIKSDYRTEYGLSGTTWVPVMAIRRKNDRQDVAIDFLGVDIFASDDVIIQIREDVTGLDGTFTDPTDVESPETAIETNTTLTTATYTSGRQRYQKMFAGGQGTSETLTSAEDIELKPSREKNLTVWARKIIGNGGTLSICARWKEQW